MIETTASSYLMTSIPVPPPPPSYSSSESSHRDVSLNAPEITVDVSYISQENSRMELLPSAGFRKPLSVDVLELREALKQQKERLKVTSSLLRTPSSSRGGGSLGVPEGEHGLNNSRSSVSSDTSIKSEVVKQAAKTASNKDNFNYLAGSQKLEQEKFELAEKNSKVAQSNEEVDVKAYESAYIEEGLEDTKLTVGEQSGHHESSII